MGSTSYVSTWRDKFVDVGGESMGCVVTFLGVSCFFLAILSQIKPLAATQQSHQKFRFLIKKIKHYALLLEIDI